MHNASVTVSNRIRRWQKKIERILRGKNQQSRPIAGHTALLEWNVCLDTKNRMNRDAYDSN
jgi:hypothetical protein